MIWIAIGLAVFVLFWVVQIGYLSAVLASSQQQSRGLGYYGRSPAERAEFKRRLETHARRLRPAIRLLGSVSGFTFEKASFEHAGVRAPLGTCSPESFAAGVNYEARPDDVFVVTQMKCGTTWMQHVVYEVLHRGAGDLVDTGTALYAVSPWLEAETSVPVDEAPTLGEERPSRLIKTHLPVSLCPWDDRARYIYVARHPAACFASCRDFIEANAGDMAPDLEAVEEWFCSDDMWWGAWPDHVASWWRRSREMDAVLFVRFEEMKSDLPSVVRRVAEFLEVEPLGEDELRRVVEKCGFDYMSQNAAAFEMHPPHLFAVDAELFVSGRADRQLDVPEDARRRVRGWCAERLAADVLANTYPDLAGS